MGIQRTRFGHGIQGLLTLCGAAEPALETTPSDNGHLARGTETLLLVEDEQALRRASAEFLCQQGYKVLQAKDGLDAIAVAENHPSAIDLLVTDVVMPNMSGGELARKLAQLRPDMKFLFVSGYAGKTVLDHKVVDLEMNFLQKPYTLKQFSLKIRAALNHSPKRQASNSQSDRS